MPIQFIRRQLRKILGRDKPEEPTNPVGSKPEGTESLVADAPAETVSKAAPVEEAVVDGNPVPPVAVAA